MNRYSTLKTKEPIGQGCHCIVDDKTSEVIAVAYEKSDAMKIVQALNLAGHDTLKVVIDLTAKVKKLQDVFNTRTWTKGMSDAWHRALPYAELAFAELLKNIGGKHESPQG